MRHLVKDIVGVQQAIRELKEDLLAFDDIKTLKAWLKKMRLASRGNDFGDCPF
jgi:hypothetical protein